METLKTDCLEANQFKRYNRKLKGYYAHADFLHMMTNYDLIIEKAINLKDALNHFVPIVLAI